MSSEFGMICDVKCALNQYCKEVDGECVTSLSLCASVPTVMARIVNNLKDDSSVVYLP